MNVLDTIINVAQTAHKDQVRKYTGEPYWYHLAGVAGLVPKFHYLVQDQVKLEVMTAVAWCHDMIEDTSFTEVFLLSLSRIWPEEKDQSDFFVGVMMLSDLEEGNRETRKALTIERFKSAKPWIKLLKVLDCKHNAASLGLKDPRGFVGIGQEMSRLLNSFDEPSIMVAVDEVLNDIHKLNHAGRHSCKCPDCKSGYLYENTERFPFYDKNGLQRFIPDMHGLWCNYCMFATFEDYPESRTKLDNMVKKGGSYIPVKKDEDV